ncbi:MAG: hemerythrin [Planctomycetes bacterium GWA2_40_7]|nr:MAG: hemerythrin [Planctomycetes bacterium GWA2_40_7]
MAIEWTQDLATGIDWQDNQHKELFKKIDSLMESMKVGKGKEEVENILNFLADYVVFHFGNEEKAMEKFSYTEYSRHRAEHTKFTNDFSGLKKQVETAASPSILVIQIQRLVVDWLKNHIGKVDKSLGAFLKTKE